MTKAKKNSHESNINRELQKVANNGKILIGARETVKALEGNEAKLVIYASNCPKELKADFRERCNGTDALIYEYPANSAELGLACGKPFTIASLCVVDVGGSEILRLLPSITYAKK